jgi:hypothetical protein
MFEGVRIVKSVFTPKEIDIFYRYLAILSEIGSLRGNKDSESAHMYYAIPYAEAILSHYTSFVSDVVGEIVYPSYSFLWNYKQGYELPKHKDRNSVDYIISLGIHSPHENKWGIYVSGKLYDMNLGDILILDGKRFEHWRDACPYPNRLQLILCYTKEQNLCFDRRKHLGLDPVPEVITSPLRKQLNIDDDYINTLRNEYV